ncbi:MAG: aconitate hydratase [Deltaproteobacteria bacterium HGW-Deltaproteobacteria-22]|jgi:aconitate hydratase|nr:MAG: aconitate hydratase [Deltaproteobacteria bacterium HGW-Deltaproteobacteria-22]
MGLTVTEKVLATHIGEGRLARGEEIGLKIDQCLTQDSTGTMSWLQFESLRLPKVKCELAVSYVDHTSLAFKGESADDHLFLQTVARRFGAWYSKPGNGVCHQVHYERFAVPGKTLLGSDSHTPTSSALGMIAIGAGGADVAVAMGGGYFFMKVPRIVRVNLIGQLQWGVSAKDIVLDVIRQLTVKGGVGCILEYAGPGMNSLTVPQRATITNMGAETGATTSIFPSDGITRDFLRRQGREQDWTPLAADPDAVYDRELTVDLDALEPLVAMPGSPDNIKTISSVEGFEIQQVYIGSCTNGSHHDLSRGAAMLRGRHVSPDIECILSPGSRQVEQHLLGDGSYASYVDAGFRMVEPGCHACIGMGYVPGYQHHSVRTVNRNWFGRGGSSDARLILASVETAIASALAGKLADPRKLEPVEPGDAYESGYLVDDSMLIQPLDAADAARVEIRRAPNIQPIRPQSAPPDVLRGEVILKVGDGISTDDILPAGGLTQHLRSNLPEIAKFTYHYIDKGFARRALEKGGGFIIGGENYGQGSSREHAAMAPWQLDVSAVLAKSFARIHRANLVNAGVVPLIADTDAIDFGDILEIDITRLAEGEWKARNVTKDQPFSVGADLTGRDREILRCGGLLAYTRKMHS